MNPGIFGRTRGLGRIQGGNGRGLFGWGQTTRPPITPTWASRTFSRCKRVSGEASAALGLSHTSPGPPNSVTTPPVLFDMVYQEVVFRELHEEHPALAEYEAVLLSLADDLRIMFAIDRVSNEVDRGREPITVPLRYTAASWSESEILTIDPGLAFDHLLTGNTRLQKPATATDKQANAVQTFVREGRTCPGRRPS